jgi:hypothetical protein
MEDHAEVKAFSPFVQMLRDALGDWLAPDAMTFADMFAQDAVFEFPFAPPGMARRARGRLEIDLHLASLADFALDDVSPPQPSAGSRGETPSCWNSKRVVAIPGPAPHTTSATFPSLN